MELSNEQIDSIRNFIASRVKNIDLQIELTDHFAEMVTQELRQKKGLTFEEAFQVTFQKIGGAKSFRNICSEKKKILRKQFLKRTKVELLGFLKFPKALLVIAFGFLTYVVLQNLIQAHEFGWFLLLGIAILNDLPFMYLYWRNRYYKNHTISKFVWMVRIGSNGLINIPIMIFFKAFPLNNTVLFIGSFLLVLMILIKYALFKSVKKHTVQFLS